MNNVKLAYLLLMVFIVALPSLAMAGGGGIGNGGNAVVCQDSSGKIISAETLDVYEARVMRNIPLQIGSSGLAVEDYLATLESRLAVQSPNRAADYKKILDGFNNNANFMSGITLVPLNDSEDIVLPAGCMRVQLIIQQEPKFAEDKRFLVNQDVWSHLDNQNRAVIMFHEAILNEMMNTRDWFCNPSTLICPWALETSEMRYFLSKIFSDKIGTLTTQQFHQLQQYVPYLFRVEAKEINADLVVLRYENQDTAFNPVTVLPVWPIDQYDSQGRVASFYPLPHGCAESLYMLGDYFGDGTMDLVCHFLSMNFDLPYAYQNHDIAHGLVDYANRKIVFNLFGFSPRNVMTHLSSQAGYVPISLLSPNSDQNYTWNTSVAF